MRGMTQRLKRARLIALLSIFSFLCLLNAAIAAEQKKETKAKTVVKTKTTQKSRTKASPKIAAPAAVISEDVVLAAFDAFTLEWMKKLADTEEFRKSRAQVKQSLDGFSAEYTGYLPHRYIHIKKTESADTPYVGILTYYEKTLRCTGKTKEEALQGPFNQVDTGQVSEIFRFTKGKWVY
jgi:hypothetical protein